MRWAWLNIKLSIPRRGYMSLETIQLNTTQMWKLDIFQLENCSIVWKDPRFLAIYSYPFFTSLIPNYLCWAKLKSICIQYLRAIRFRSLFLQWWGKALARSFPWDCFPRQYAFFALIRFSLSLMSSPVPVTHWIGFLPWVDSIWG